MKKIDEGYDPLLKSNYELYSVKFGEFKELALSWYPGVDLKLFDARTGYSYKSERDENLYIQMKRTGIICNYFYGYNENGKYYLMDGYNRLFTDYGKLDVDTTVYVKILTSELKDNQLMYIMFTLNMWKLKNNDSSYYIKDFFDRGFRLFIHSKFDIDLYENRGHHDERLRYKPDIDILLDYFTNERADTAMFKFKFDELAVLMSRTNIVNDFKELISSNNYIIKPFPNFDKFLSGFAMFLSYKRLTDPSEEIHKFEYYLGKLYEDKKFFKKLQGMSWTDSTRQNIYRFYRNLK